MERDDEEILEECETGGREAGFAFTSLAALTEWPRDVIPDRWLPVTTPWHPAPPGT